jgi:hypothetical protein
VQTSKRTATGFCPQQRKVYDMSRFVVAFPARVGIVCCSLLRPARFRCSSAIRMLCHDANGPSKQDRKNASWKEHVQSLIDNKEINTIPNMITISRIVASPLLSIFIANDMKYAALGGCVIFGFTDWLDGYLAKKLNQQTVLGAFLDPMADKILIGAVTVGKPLVVEPS